MSSSVYIPAGSSGGGSAVPSSVVQLTSAGYTVPAGKYAKLNYELNSGVLNINGNLVASGSCYQTTYASASTTAAGTTEVTIFTNTSTTQGNFIISCSSAAGALNATCTFRHRRAGILIQSIAFQFAGNPVSGSFQSYCLTGDTFTVQQTSSSSNSRSVALVGSTKQSLFSENGQLHLPTGTVITFSSSLPVSVSGLIELYDI